MPHVDTPERMRRLFFVLGVVQVGLGMCGFLLPRPFYESIIDVGRYNPHFVRDVASVYVAIGAGTLVGAWQPSWQLPSVILGIVAFGGNAISTLLALDFAGRDVPAVSIADLLGHMIWTAALIALIPKLTGFSPRVMGKALARDTVGALKREWAPHSGADQNRNSGNGSA